MRLRHDREADAIYIKLNELPYAFGEDLDSDRRVDFDQDGTPIGIELLNVSRGVRLDNLPEAEHVGPLLDKEGIVVFAYDRQ